MAEFSLAKMAAGGMYDHVGGGFHRYFRRRVLARAALREGGEHPSTRYTAPMLTGLWHAVVSSVNSPDIA